MTEDNNNNNNNATISNNEPAHPHPKNPNPNQEQVEAVKFDTKKLYFFAGPHKCASTSVEKFFRSWAANGAVEGHVKFSALRYWRWPTFDDTEAEKEYGALVKRNDDVGYEKMALDAINQKFDESDNGVVLGTEEFDQVGPDKYYDALPIMETIRDKLDVSPPDVRVILNYRAPRLDQWVSLWKHADGQYEDVSYAFFLCKAHKKKAHRTIRRSMIGAEMNPLGAARVFLKQGWKVTLMDMGGVSKAGHNIAHAIGCEVLKGQCNQDGTLAALGTYMPNKNVVDKDFVGLNYQESKKAETLFLHRDCAYKEMLKPYLKTGQLEILYQDTLWTSCNAPQEYYDRYIDNTDLMYNALLSQVKCVDDPENYVLSEAMDAALSGGEVIAPSKSGLENLDISLFDTILIVALVLALFQLVRQRMSGGARNSSSSSGPWGQLVQQRMGGNSNDTEMTPYPRRVYRDDDDQSDDGDVGGFRDDVSLDEEEISDQPSSLPRGSGASVGSRSTGSHSLSGRI